MMVDDQDCSQIPDFLSFKNPVYYSRFQLCKDNCYLLNVKSKPGSLFA